MRIATGLSGAKNCKAVDRSSMFLCPIISSERVLSESEVTNIAIAEKAAKHRSMPYAPVLVIVYASKRVFLRKYNSNLNIGSLYTYMVIINGTTTYSQFLVILAL